MTHWSQDADGDVFRRLAADKFDFDAVHDIDFNIAFVDWPPSPEFLAQLQRQYSDFRVFEKEDKSSGYVQFSIHAKLTYELVMFVQLFSKTIDADHFDFLAAAFARGCRVSGRPIVR